MFGKEIYSERRRTLAAKMRETAAEGKAGIAVFIGNSEAPQNYRGNDYKFRQESSFLYFWGTDEPGFCAIIDFDSGSETLYGDDFDIDDIIWMGPQESVADKAGRAGATGHGTAERFTLDVQKALAAGRRIHFLPASRYCNTLKISSLLGISPEDTRKTAPVSALPGGRPAHASEELVKAVISMRLIKQQCEIEEIDKACEICYLMHTAARQGCKPGVHEQEIAGRMDGITLSKGWGVSFATILSQHGETLHNHSHDGIITPGKLLLVDAGAESGTHYAADFTRTYPCSGKFTRMQADIYDIVESCNALAFSLAKPGTAYRDIHLAVEKLMLESLASLGIVRGNADDMVQAGVAGLFMPHGLGHNMGIDVHDMEDLGENLVGYDEDQTRAGRLGLGSLRMARKLRPGHVVTDEPGIYFIPALIDKWKAEGTDRGFVNYSALEKYRDFGGIRLEDDLLITENGARYLGFRRLPIKASDVEEAMASE